MADVVYVIGDQTSDRGNREVVHVEDGADTDLPAAAAFSYESTYTKFPYTTS